MTRSSYPGLTDKVRAFEALRPLVMELQKLQLQCKPFGRDYHAIAISLEALESTAYHFTRRPHFYGALGGHR
jgi:hypothetical protein